MPLQKIPLDTAPNQKWRVAVDINGGVSVFFVQLRYNEIAAYWTMDISDSSQVPMLTGVPLLTGLNVLSQYAYLEIGSVYVLNSSGVTSPDYPNNTDLGSDFVLVWGDNASFLEQVAA